MGTIAELLGYNLSGDEPEEDVAPEPVEGEGEAPSTGPTRGEEAVMAAVLEYTELEPGEARDDVRLVEDLDLDALSRWAIVAAVERELSLQFADADVEAWQTLGDILGAVRPS